MSVLVFDWEYESLPPRFEVALVRGRRGTGGAGMVDGKIVRQTSLVLGSERIRRHCRCKRRRADSAAATVADIIAGWYDVSSEGMFGEAAGHKT